jgi:hypothetical protein
MLGVLIHLRIHGKPQVLLELMMFYHEINGERPYTADGDTKFAGYV